MEKSVVTYELPTMQQLCDFLSQRYQYHKHLPQILQIQVTQISKHQNFYYKSRNRRLIFILQL